MKELVEKINAEIEQFQKNADLQVTKGNKILVSIEKNWDCPCGAVPFLQGKTPSWIP